MSKGDWQPHKNDPVMRVTNMVTGYVRDLASSGLVNNMAIDGNATPTVFKKVPPAGKYWMITRMLVFLSDSTAFAEEKFGGIAALPLGVQILINNTELVNWQDNIDINTCMYDTVGREIFAKVDKSLAGRWTFAKMGSKYGVRIDDHVNGFGINIRDNLGELDHFRIAIQGMEHDLLTARR